ncbi:MAG: hypothetical protein Q7N50_00300, partial [Armatimonadota bacterium]|nr:hypothetical protein [Armatimonadota bacterium]
CIIYKSRRFAPTANARFAGIRPGYMNEDSVTTRRVSQMGNKKSNKGHSKNSNKQKRNMQQSAGGSKGGALGEPIPERSGRRKKHK